MLGYAASAALGSLTNTLGVMGGIWLFFGGTYSSLAGSTMLILIGSTILTSGIPEAIVCAMAASAVCRAVRVMIGKRA